MTRAGRRLSLAALVLVLVVTPLASQTRQSTPTEPLFRTLASLDRELFDAYNKCDLDKFASYFADEIEFYHDKTGVARGLPVLVASLKDNICGKTRRDLIAGTMEVHPMDNYGALQIGMHRFCEVKSLQCDDKSGGVGKFIHLWQNTNGVWKITRVFSYDHAPAVK